MKQGRDRSISEVLKIFETVRKETEGKTSPEEFQGWVDLYSLWIDVWREFGEALSSEETFSSLLVFRATEIFKSLLWIGNGMWSGAYHSTVQQLRYILESAIQAYYVDKENNGVSIERKLEIIKEIEYLIGRRLIDKTDLKYKEELKTLYGDLCKYVHPSYEELETVIGQGKVDSHIIFTFDKELYLKSVEFMGGVFDVFTLAFLSCSAKLSEKIKEGKFTVKMRDLEEYKMSLSLGYLKKEGLKGAKCLH